MEQFSGKFSRKGPCTIELPASEFEF